MEVIPAAKRSPKLLIFGTHPRHLVLLVRLTDQHPRPPPRRATLAHIPDFFVVVVVVVTAAVVGRVVQRREAQAGDLLGDGGAQAGALLADAAGKDERVDLAAQRDVVRADEGADAVDDQVEGEAALRAAVVVVVVGGGDGGKVGRARQRLPPGLLVENLLGARDVQLLGRGRGEAADVACVVEDEAGGGRGWSAWTVGGGEKGKEKKKKNTGDGGERNKQLTSGRHSRSSWRRAGRPVG